MQLRKTEETPYQTAYPTNSAQTGNAGGPVQSEQTDGVNAAANGEQTGVVPVASTLPDRYAKNEIELQPKLTRRQRLHNFAKKTAVFFSNCATHQALYGNLEGIIALAVGIASLLFRRGAAQEEVSPLALACTVGNRDLALRLIESGVDVNGRNSRGEPVLQCAVSMGLTDVVERLLLDPKLDVNAQDRLGHTALQEAVHYNSSKIVGLLLGHPDINVNLHDVHKYTPLHEAVTRMTPNTEIIGLLLGHPDIKVNAQISNGFTPLHIIATHTPPDQEVVDMLLNHDDIDPNVQDAHKQTPLHIAANFGHEEMLQGLVNRGGDPNLLDTYKHAPLFWAEEHRNYACIDILKPITSEAAHLLRASSGEYVDPKVLLRPVANTDGTNPDELLRAETPE